MRGTMLPKTTKSPRSRLAFGAAALAAAAVVALAACSDSTAPNTNGARTDDQMNFLTFAAGAPPLATTSVSFYAVRGEDREIAIWYRPAPGQSDSSKFIEFKVPGAALVSRPDGTPIAVGDSLLITVSVNDTTHMIANFQPSGLRFATGVPARLKMEFAEADDDYNHDGVVDSKDQEAETQFSFWKQEAPGLPWTKVGSAVAEDLKEVEADITGFTGYAISY